jgi:hypothetical protein
VGLQWSDTPGAPQEVRYVQEVSEEYTIQRDRGVPMGLEVAVREALEQMYATLWREGMMPVSWSIEFESGTFQVNPYARPTVTLKAMAVRNGQTPEFIVRAAMGLPLEGL